MNNDRSNQPSKKRDYNQFNQQKQLDDDILFNK